MIRECNRTMKLANDKRQRSDDHWSKIQCSKQFIQRSGKKNAIALECRIEKRWKMPFRKNILLSNRKSKERLRLLLIMWMVSSTVVAPWIHFYPLNSEISPMYFIQTDFIHSKLRIYRAIIIQSYIAWREFI